MQFVSEKQGNIASEGLKLNSFQEMVNTMFQKAQILGMILSIITIISLANPSTDKIMQVILKIHNHWKPN